MQYYRVLDRVNHDGVIHGPGAVLEMEPEAAEALVELGVLEQAEGPREAGPADADGGPGGTFSRTAMLLHAAEAARDLAADKLTLTTKGGVVTVEALEAMTGFEDVTAAERNAVWAEATAGADPGQGDGGGGKKGDPGQGDGGGE